MPSGFPATPTLAETVAATSREDQAKIGTTLNEATAPFSDVIGESYARQSR
jgi:hypothetical protein